VSLGDAGDAPSLVVSRLDDAGSRRRRRRLPPRGCGTAPRGNLDERRPRARRGGGSSSRPSASASTSMRPAAGSNTVTIARTAGTSTSPRRPPRMT
jgi:hypothetical protein